MSYENPPQPEGINVSDTHPLREFFSLLLMLLLIVVVAITVLTLTAQWLAQYIPFSTEQRLAGMFSAQIEMLQEHDATSVDPEVLKREAYLRELAQRLQAHMDLPQGMTVTVHYSTEDTVNAFAMLGGHVVMFAGLVDQLPNENALAMVLAHEIAHVELRHPVVAMSRGLTVSVALASIFGLTDNAGVAQLVEWLGVTSTLSFSRSQERAADRRAAQALLAEYGHLEGATDLFEVFADELGGGDASSGLRMPEFRATHPALSERIAALRDQARELGVTGKVIPLPWRQDA
ncbi:MAG: M48 family metallopeptidase [Pseudomonadales bacterium]